jgi:hypothetical protein
MLAELVVVLDYFEWATNEFQSNKVSVSRVYPTIMALRNALIDNIDDYSYTQKLRKDLLDSLNARFDSLVANDVFLISTFLDPNFGKFFWQL